MLADSHVHSHFSDDSSYPAAKIAQDAIRLNLDSITFTGRMDYGVNPDAGIPDEKRSKEGGSVDYGVKPDVDTPDEKRPKDGGSVPRTGCVHHSPDDTRSENGLPVLNVDYAHYFPEIERIQEEHRGTLEVLRGLEFVVQRHRIDDYEALLARWGAHLGAYLRQGQRQLHELGFKEFHTFVGGEPVAHRIES